jgi:restriction system protein
VKGIFVTTGSYSRLAVEHAKSLSPPIELVDRHLLLDLASRAGIRLVTESGRERIYTYRIADDRTLLEKISARLDSYLVSRPRRSYEMLVLKQRQINLRPIYWVEYDVDAEFSTTVGVIHTERASGRVFVDGNEGAVMIDELGRFVSGIPTQAVVPFDEISKELSGVSNPQFKMSLSDIKEIAFQHIVARHTKQVSYSGRNNQIYNKLCEPGRNDIFINDVSQIYLPENSIIFSLLGRIHTMAFADCGKADIHVYQDDTSRCQLCGQTLKNGGFICNNCGAIACKRKSLFKSKLHGFVCEQCGTTVCANCAYWIRKMLFFKSILCPKCSQRMVEQGKRSIKLK